ncbi:MAG: zinc-ribbon domain-containing protein [Planctomycetota bacterium]
MKEPYYERMCHMALIKCKECGKDMSDTATVCPHCGFSDKPKSAKGMTVVGLLLNMFIWPGVGTIIGGNLVRGIIQMICWVIGWIVAFAVIFSGAHWAGSVMLFPIFVWIWVVVSSIIQIQKSK